MSARYLVGNAIYLEAVRVALDKANGLRDSSGNPTPKRARIFRGGVEVTGHADWDPNERGVFVGTTSVTSEPIDDGSGGFALDIPDEPWINTHLGKSVSGMALPSALSLVGEDSLPPGLANALAVRRGLSSQAAPPAAANGQRKGNE